MTKGRIAVFWFVLAGCHSQPAPADTRGGASSATDNRWRYLSSEELMRAGDPDTVYIRRMRAFEQLVRETRTDSLAKLYLASLDATPENVLTYVNAIGCQYAALIRRYGGTAPQRAIQLMEDSLFSTPALRQRWIAAQRLWPQIGSTDHPCDVSSIPPAPDSLFWRPQKLRPPSWLRPDPPNRVQSSP